MLTWGALRGHLVAHWEVVTVDDDWAGLLVDAGGVAVRVVVKPTPDAARVIVCAQVCPMARLPAEEALRYNGGSAHGMLMLEESAYVLRQIVSLAPGGADEIDETVDAMALEAARLRRHVAGEPAPIDATRQLFAFMAD